MKFLKKLYHKIANEKVSESIIDTLFECSEANKFHIMRAFILAQVCLHEAGHYVVACRHHLTIENVRFPKYDFAMNQEATDMPVIEIARGIAGSEDRSISEAEHKEFLLGGFLGELNIYERSADMIAVYPQGSMNDLINYVNAFPADPLTTKLRVAVGTLNRDNLLDYAEFMKIFAPFDTPLFAWMNRNRDVHRTIASDMLAQWSNNNFDSTRVVIDYSKFRLVQ